MAEWGHPVRVESLELQIEHLHDLLGPDPIECYIGGSGLRTFRAPGSVFVGTYTQRVGLEQFRGDVFAGYDEWRGK